MADWIVLPVIVPLFLLLLRSWPLRRSCVDKTQLQYLVSGRDQSGYVSLGRTATARRPEEGERAAPGKAISTRGFGAPAE
ncbi:hypothetical protein ACRAWF_06600, partial [Streptomyces sp. L7]